jgi:hypothetical protein
MLEGFSWITRTYDVGFCVTFARGLDEQEMLRRFGGDPSHAWPIRCRDIFALQEIEGFEDLQGYEGLEHLGPIIQIGSCKNWAFALEDPGYFGAEAQQGTRPEVLCAVSANSIAVSMYKDAKANYIFSYAENGEFVAWFDALCQYGSDNWDKTPALLPLLQQAGFGPREHWFDRGKDPIAVMSALAEAIGVCLDLEAVAEKPLLTGKIVPGQDEKGIRHERASTSPYRGKLRIVPLHSNDKKEPS